MTNLFESPIQHLSSSKWPFIVFFSIHKGRVCLEYMFKTISLETFCLEKNSISLLVPTTQCCLDGRHANGPPYKKWCIGNLLFIFDILCWRHCHFRLLKYKHCCHACSKPNEHLKAQYQLPLWIYANQYCNLRSQIPIYGSISFKPEQDIKLFVPAIHCASDKQSTSLLKSPIK